jgi:hypothetical protein
MPVFFGNHHQEFILADFQARKQVMIDEIVTCKSQIKAVFRQGREDFRPSISSS